MSLPFLLSRFSLFLSQSLLTMMLALSFAGAPANAGTVAGDTFTVRVLLDGIEIASATDVAGSGNLDLCSVGGAVCTAGSSHSLDWLDGDTFRVDWFDTTQPAPSSVVYEIEGLDFVQGATGHGILGLTRSPSNFPPAQRLEVTFEDRSIRLNYAGLSPADAGDGDFATFDVETDADLVDLYSIEIFEENLSIASGTHVRGQGGEFDVIDINFGPQYAIEWFGDESFRIDWVTPEVEDIRIEITGLDFESQAREVGDLDNVIKNDALYPADPTVSFDASSITLDYADLLLMPFPESNDGDYRVFDLITTIPDVDFYTVELIEDGSPIRQGTGVRGLSDRYGLSGNYEINWVDADSFVIDWYSDPTTSLEWEITFVNLRDNMGNPGTITNVVKNISGFDDDPTVTFSDDSITIEYASLIDPDSGDSRQFDLTIVPEPTSALSIAVGSLSLSCFGLRRRREQMRTRIAGKMGKSLAM